jgi:small nuclear ribonucleoprotein (snRNP)-like protein
MPIFHCPICNFKSFTEKDEKEHAKTHQKPGQPTEPEVKKPEEQKKEFKIPNIIIKFLLKNVSITLIDGSTISGILTEFNNYDLLIDDKIMIPKHAMMKMQEVEANP